MKNYATNFTQHFGYPEEWHRSDLPHRNKNGLVQFITYRLADSLPREILSQIKREVACLDNEIRNAEQRKKYHDWLDNGLGSCALSNREMAHKMMDALNYHDGNKYNLLAWTIMPNHVHVLIKCLADIARIVQSWKSYTGRWGLANNVNLSLGLNKNATAFWMTDYWDRFIRNENHFDNTVKYILNNPGKARLPEYHVAYEFTGMKI